MKTADLTIEFVVDNSPAEVFRAINNVRGWWINEIDGKSEKPDDEFAVTFFDVHYSKQKLLELIPDKKVVWLVTDSKLTFVEDQNEWTGTKIIFEISASEDKTLLRFTHHGLHSGVECFRDCSNAWGGYISRSLFKLITTGTGEPTEVVR